MIYINHSFFPSLFLTEVQHYACALNIPICPTGTTMVSPGGLPGTLHCFRQLPGTPGEADESAPAPWDGHAAAARIDHLLWNAFGRFHVKSIIHDRSNCCGKFLKNRSSISRDTASQKIEILPQKLRLTATSRHSLTNNSSNN